MNNATIRVITPGLPLKDPNETYFGWPFADYQRAVIIKEFGLENLPAGQELICKEDDLFLTFALKGRSGHFAYYRPLRKVLKPDLSQRQLFNLEQLAPKPLPRMPHQNLSSPKITDYVISDDIWFDVECSRSSLGGGDEQ